MGAVMIGQNKIKNCHKTANQELKSCEYCGKPLMVVDDSFCSIKSFHAHCLNCLFRGPNATSYQEAINKLYNKSKLK